MGSILVTGSAVRCKILYYMRLDKLWATTYLLHRIYERLTGNEWHRFIYDGEDEPHKMFQPKFVAMNGSILSHKFSSS